MPRQPRWDPAALDELARAGGGVVLRRDLVQLGLPATSIEHRLRETGPWQRMLPGTYLTHRGAPSQIERVRAGLAYAGPRAVLSGPAALRLRRFRAGTADPRVHLLVPHDTRRQDAGFVVLERTRRLPSPIWVAGLPCASVARTAVDSGRWSDNPRDVRALVAEAVQRGRCDVEELVEELDQANAKWTRSVRSALADVVPGVRSVAEGDARRLVIRAGLPEPRWNVSVHAPDGTFLACPDAWWDELGVAWQIDSREWHLSPEDWEATVRRHASMTRYGVLVVHSLPKDIGRRGAEVVDEVGATLEAAARRPAPRLIIRERTGHARAS